MHRLFGFFLTVAAVLTLALVLPGAAVAQSEDRNVKEFATGSAKADLAVASTEHMSFSAHSLPPTSANACPATGNVEYTAELSAGELHIKGKVVNLVILGSDPGVEGAFMVTQNQYVTLNGAPVTPFPAFSWWDVTDSNQSGGTGDTILLEQLNAPPVCFGPLIGHPITQGNVNIEAEPL